MKKMMFILCGLLSTGVQAEAWSPPLEIKDINAGYRDGFIILTTKSSFFNPESCTNGAYAIHPDAANVDHSLSLLLSAQARNKKVRVAVSGCATKVTKYPNVTRIRLSN